MAQLHFYVDAATESELRRRAAAAGLPLSRYLADVVKGTLGGGWPEDWFGRTAGAWAGPAHKRDAAAAGGDLRLPFDLADQ